MLAIAGVSIKLYRQFVTTNPKSSCRFYSLKTSFFFFFCKKSSIRTGINFKKNFEKDECKSHQNYPQSQFEEYHGKNRLYMQCIGIGISKKIRGSLSKVFEESGPKLLNLLLLVHKPLIA